MEGVASSGLRPGILTESTFVCLRENGACFLLLRREGKRQYESFAHTTGTIRKTLFQRALFTTFDYISFMFAVEYESIVLQLKISPHQNDHG
jgi:hypothetical protein